jgi:Co/Zn/Cd efflux system component
MGANCCATEPTSPQADPRWRRALWIALAINGAMFVLEIVAGLAGQSMALRADALDFLGDSTNYAISLAVLGTALSWRSRAALLKGAMLGAFGVWVLGSTAWAAWHGTTPHAQTMGIVGVMALVTNVGVALMLFRHRTGDANMRAVWICSRNDAIGNVAVVLAAGGVLGTRSAWPDLVVAALMASLALWGSAQIIAHALRELGASRPTTTTHGHHA